MTTALYTEKQIARGYAVDYKRVVLAYSIEATIVITSLVGAYYFMRQYSYNENTAVMMMLAPCAYALVEFCRVPLAISLRKPNYSWFVKLILIIGLLGAATITVKSISQLGEIMFRPRLFDVIHAREKLVEAESGVVLLVKQIEDSDALVAQRKAELEALDKQRTGISEQLGNLPKQQCSATAGVARNGHAYRGMKCVPDSRIPPLVEAMKNATTIQEDASARLDEATAQRNKLDRTTADKVLREEKTNYREAVMNSQLHSFTAMFFGIEPTDVTDAQIHLFLRIFVFVPAIGAAFAATIIALTAIIRIPPAVPDHVELSADGGEYILGPLAANIIREATEAHIKSMNDRMPPVLHAAREAFGERPARGFAAE